MRNGKGNGRSMRPIRTLFTRKWWRHTHTHTHAHTHTRTHAHTHAHTAPSLTVAAVDHAELLAKTLIYLPLRQYEDERVDATDTKTYTLSPPTCQSASQSLNQ
eukprot:GHVU01173866.1.p5 GENE.GHVU01173866.1~~GHVU01173866.1.p5  ORF type:complete len:103 (+),score=3.37 GHVU01173866.1:1358-1666(+)